MKRIIIIFAGLLACAAMNAEVVMPSFFSDNMVLQRETEVTFWGLATPGKKVTVTATWKGSKKVQVTADEQTGKWMVKVPTPVAGGPYKVTVSDGKPFILDNVLIGEVWFCSGQSNMEMPMKGYTGQPVKGATDKILSAKPSRNIRICNIVRKAAKEETYEVNGAWQLNTPEAVASTSATAYYYADKLEESLGIPVGIFISCWGGSTIEAWLTKATIANYLADEFSLDHLKNNEEIKNEQKAPCMLFNGQIAPLIPFTFRGIVWYQGESNRARPGQYTRLQNLYVDMMRRLFKNPDAPFYYVQVAPYKYKGSEQFVMGYLVEAQAKTMDGVRCAYMASTTDIGEQQTIHPCRKQEVGYRLAYLALQHTYGVKGISADAPRFRSVEFKDGKALVDFNNVSELGLAPIHVQLTGFELAGEDRKFYPAEASVESDLHPDQVAVHCNKVSKPVAVRYCFRNGSEGNLYNAFGIPAVPFRTDNWDDLVE